MINGVIKNRDLLIGLVSKELHLRYQRSALGFFWTLILPLAQALVFYVIFYKLMKTRLEEAPFIPYLMSGVFTWHFFQVSVSAACRSFVENKSLIMESAFPVYLIPVSIVLANAVVFLPTLAVILAVCLCFLGSLPLFVALLPLVFVVHCAITLGVSLSMAIVYVRWRDLTYVLDTLLLLLFYSTPVFYSLTLISTTVSGIGWWLYALNPFTCILNLYRCVFFNGYTDFLSGLGSLAASMFSAVAAGVLFMLIAGWLYSRHKDSIHDHVQY